jgi:hypothetical protein
MAKENLNTGKLKVRLYKLKIALYEGFYRDKGPEWHDGAHQMLTQVLNILDEYQDYQ